MSGDDIGWELVDGAMMQRAAIPDERGSRGRRSRRGADRIRGGLYLALALLVTACAARPLPGDLPRLLSGLEQTHPDQRRIPLLDRLPPPQRVTVHTVPNLHDPATLDRVVTRHYPGLDLSIYEASAVGKELPLRLRVTSPRYRTAEGLRVGSSVDEVRAALGPPDDAAGSELLYLSDEPTPDVLRVKVQEQRVAELNWDFYID